MRARVVLLMALTVAGCRRDAAAPSSAAGSAPVPSVADAAAPRREVVDGMGRKVTLPATVRRVISLAPSATEVVYALGAGALLVGRDKYSDYPPAVATVETVGADLDPSLERITGLRPDIVLANRSANSQRSVEAMERLGLPVYVSQTETLAAILDDVRRVGELLDRRADGERLAAALSARVEAVRARVAGAPATKAVVVVWPDPLTVAGGATHVDELVRAAGGANVAAGSAQPYPTYSLERLIAQAPEVIVVGTHADANRAIPPAFARLRTIPAVRDGRVLAVDGDLIFRPGPRVVDGVERLAALLHPERAGAAAMPDGGAR